VKRRLIGGPTGDETELDVPDGCTRIIVARSTPFPVRYADVERASAERVGALWAAVMSGQAIPSRDPLYRLELVSDHYELREDGAMHFVGTESCKEESTHGDR